MGGQGEEALWAPALAQARVRGLCTDCGLSRMADAGLCGRACQFLKPDYPALERRVHGRERDPARGDERFFGPYLEMYRAALNPPRPGAQWTGIATRLAERLLETGEVDAVLAMTADPADRWRPQPVVVTQAAGMARCRGMRMGYAPLLAQLEPALARGYRRLAVIGVPCQVYPLRVLQPELEARGLEQLTVIGIPCSDNTTTENFHTFLSLLAERPESVTYLEFLADYHVELRFSDGSKRKIPFLLLPISKLAADFFPMTCRTCVDYPNSLADITVGYMGGQGQQWLVVRNRRGREVLQRLGNEVELGLPGSAGKRQGPVKGFLANTERMAGGLPVRGMPNWIRPLVGWLMPRVGPRGLEFARARVEMKAVETVLHLRRAYPKRLNAMVPDHVWALVADYGLTPEAHERRS